MGNSSGREGSEDSGRSESGGGGGIVTVSPNIRALGHDSEDDDDDALDQRRPGTQGEASGAGSEAQAAAKRKARLRRQRTSDSLMKAFLSLKKFDAREVTMAPSKGGSTSRADSEMVGLSWESTESMKQSVRLLQEHWLTQAGEVEGEQERILEQIRSNESRVRGLEQFSASLARDAEQYKRGVLRLEGIARRMDEAKDIAKASVEQMSRVARDIESLELEVSRVEARLGGEVLSNITFSMAEPLPHNRADPVEEEEDDGGGGLRVAAAVDPVGAVSSAEEEEEEEEDEGGGPAAAAAALEDPDPARFPCSSLPVEELTRGIVEEIVQIAAAGAGLDEE